MTENAKPSHVKGKKILVVDDDENFRKILEKNLNRNGHETKSAVNGKQATSLLTLEPFDLIISDIRMPEMNGIQLLHWTKTNCPIPLILMTGFSEIAETHEAIELGARGFLAKPFKTEEMLSTISDCFPSESSKKEIENLDQTFCKISIDDFVSGREMQFDIYLRISESKYVKVAHGGEDIPLDRIRVYKSKNIKFMYVKREDFKKYLDFNISLTALVSESKKIDHQKKINFVKHTSEVLLQNLYTTEIEKESFIQACTVVENSLGIISESADATELLVSLSNHTDFLYAHSVGVSLYSCLIGKAMGWKSAATIFRLSVGGLLHDIGKKELPREVLNKPRRELTPEEVSLIETHTMRGVQILSQMQYIPTDVLQIVNEHHENCLGLGYPAHLKKSKINPLARVVTVANEFCNLVIKNPNGTPLKPTEAIHRLCSLNIDYFDSDAIKALLKLFNVSEELYFPKDASLKNRVA